MEFLISKFLN